MALPHLVVERKQNTNFKNHYEADFVTKARRQHDTRTSQEAFVERQCKYDNFNVSYDKLISDNAYEKSLTSYIALRNKARKANDLIYRRDRLSYLLKNEHEMYLKELLAMDTPKCKILYDDIRQKGFFERLYEENNSRDTARSIPPHLVSEYEQDLYGNADGVVNKAKYDLSKKRELQRELLSQQNETILKREEERRKRIEEELDVLQAMKLKDENDRLQLEKQKQIRRTMAKESLSDVRSSRKNQTALETALDEAAEEEALKANARWIAQKALDEARRQELLDETRKVQADQRQEKVYRRELDYLRKADERLENEEINRRLAADKEDERRRKYGSYQMNRAAYDEQMQYKYDRMVNESEKLKKEQEDDQNAERAYQALLLKEAEKLRSNPYADYRYKSYKFG